MAELHDASNLTPPVGNVVVDVPGWQKVQPRIPDTQQRRELEKRRSIRQIVFGVQDGILTTLGIITGVGVAEGDRSAVFISGFLALLAGALAMGVGEYLGRKAEREVVQATIVPTAACPVMRISRCSLLCARTGASSMYNSAAITRPKRTIQRTAADISVDP